VSKDKRRPVKIAMHKARKEMEIKSSGKNTHQKYEYATINDIYNGVIDPLDKQGCMVSHERFVQDGMQCMRTTIEHLESGDSIVDECFVVSEKPGNQGLGIATTYMKKDAIRCLLALPSKDDDGQGEQDHIKEQSGKPASMYSIERLQELIKQTSNPSRILQQVYEHNDVTDLNDLADQKCQYAIQYLEKILKLKK